MWQVAQAPSHVAVGSHAAGYSDLKHYLVVCLESQVTLPVIATLQGTNNAACATQLLLSVVQTVFLQGELAKSSVCIKVWLCVRSWRYFVVLEQRFMHIRSCWQRVADDATQRSQLSKQL